MVKILLQTLRVWQGTSVLFALCKIDGSIPTLHMRTSKFRKTKVIQFTDGESGYFTEKWGGGQREERERIASRLPAEHEAQCGVSGIRT